MPTTEQDYRCFDEPVDEQEQDEQSEEIGDDE